MEVSTSAAYFLPEGLQGCLGFKGLGFKAYSTKPKTLNLNWDLESSIRESTCVVAFRAGPGMRSWSRA